jgi:hypothetical protein
MLRLFRLFLAFGAVVVAINPAFAKIEANTIDELNAAIAWHGCRQQLVRDEQLATLLVTCDEDVMRSDHELRNWYFVGEMTDEYAREHKEKLAAMFGEWIAHKAMFIYYKTDPTLDQMVVIGNAVGYNDYGKPLDDITFNFGFDRELYQKLDPHHMNQSKVRKIAKRFLSYDLKLEDDE